ncbi:MAG: hypothetical protein U0228_25550 [Myxococcaceae bacterium]
MPRTTVVLLALAFAACGPTDTCDSSNCPGCCLAGVCSAGTTASSCGSRGNLCISCPSGTACSSGSCTGVIGGGAGGGTGGCTGLDSCSTPTDLCLNSVCTSGLGRGYRVTFVSATAPSTDSTGAAWDAFGGAPDLKACLVVDTGTPVCTNEATDVFTANWNQSTQVTVVASTALHLTLYDVDVSSDDTIEGFNISSSVFVAWARKGGVTGKLSTNAVTTWNIRIDPL